MQNVVKPKAVSLEDALRNLASRLTGTPVAELPRTQEAIVQYMAENIPSLDEMAEAVARLSAKPADTENTQEVAETKKGSKAKTTE